MYTRKSTSGSGDSNESGKQEINLKNTVKEASTNLVTKWMYTEKRRRESKMVKRLLVCSRARGNALPFTEREKLGGRAWTCGFRPGDGWRWEIMFK